LAFQIFLASIALWSLPVAAVLTERDSLLSKLDLANSRLQAENERKSQMVVGLQRELVNVEERERLRLSHELHDQTGQALAAASMELRRIETRLGEDDRAWLHQVRQEVEQIARTVHRISTELRPAAIDELGLSAALANYVSDWSERFGVEVDFHCSDTKLDELPDPIPITVYCRRSSCQHLQTCGSYHGQPRNQWRAVSTTGDHRGQRVWLRDGVVHRAAAKFPGGGLGIAGMRERLLLVGGELEIESSPGGGTTVFARIAV
jgi:signal transduction histidine kinase